MKKINIGLLGLGTVGAGVVKLLAQNSELIAARVGTPIVLKSASDIDNRRQKALDLDPEVFTTDSESVVDDPEIQIIIELIGGQTIARELILRAIKNGKHVVTANKALLANQGQSIFRAASQAGVDLAFEPSVGGCMPIIKVLRESLVGNRISAISGILNGTCNYILTQIKKENLSFEAALAEAQSNGYAEADPTMDVEGFDTAHKLAILTSLAYGMKINFKDIYIEGISKIAPMDIQIANEFGYRIRLLAISKLRGDSVEARVHPTMIPLSNILSSVKGALNAVTVTGDAVGDILLYGQGAGQMPTASAVISDVVDIARNLMCGTQTRVPPLSFMMQNIREIPVVPMADISSHYYIRFAAQDRPGVLSKISGILGENEISIKSVQQKGRKLKGTVPIVMLTHMAREASVQKALADISRLDIISYKPTLIRIEDDKIDE